MHIPDGFLDLKTVSATNAFSFGFLFYSIKKITKKLNPERIPLLGLSCAFIFTLEVISFPLPGGTTVHLSGAFFISLILGPFSGFFITFISLFVQALILGHGGILTIGANSLNIAFTGCVMGYYFYKFFEGLFPSFKTFWIFIISFLTLITGSLLLLVELTISGKILFSKSLFPVLFAHTTLGIIEGIFTVSAISFLQKVKPEILKTQKI